MYVKKGIIRDGDGEHPFEYKAKRWGDRPVCPVCGCSMSQREETAPTSDYPAGQRFIWWCGGEECSEARHRKHLAHRNVNADDLVAHGVPRGYVGCTIGNFQSRSDTRGHRKMFSGARTYVENPRGTVLFTGTTGSGKTHLAVGMLRRMMEKVTRDVWFASVPSMLLDLQDSYRSHPSEGADSAKDIVRRFCGYRFLILDDLGAEKSSEHTASMLGMIIEQRISNDKPTIITSNLSLTNIRDTIDARIASRLAREVWSFDFPDYRKKLAQGRQMDLVGLGAADGRV